MGFSLSSPLSCYFLQSLCVLSYCSAILAVALFDPLFGLVGYVGHPWPIYFPRALLAIFPALHSHRLLLTPLGFLIPITLSFMDFLSTPYFPYFYYFGLAVAHSHFCISHTTHGFAYSLFPGSFRPVYFLIKAHLFISWACNPLFLPLGFNGFSIYLLTLFCPCC